jgi:hypothetical protein
MMQTRRNPSIVLALLVGLSCTVPSQTPIGAGTAPGPGALRRHVVRDSAGTLYALSTNDLAGTRPLGIQASLDGGQTWTALPVTLNSASSGLSGTNPTNACAMAIDSGDRLHIVWGSYYYPSFFQQFYRWYEPASTLSSPEISLSALTGSAVTSRTDAMCVEVDAADTVWIASQSPPNWISVLLRSNVARAQDGTFTSLGPLSASASSQAPVLAVDLTGNVHAAYYRNTGVGIYEHRAYLAGQSGFGPATTLGNATAPQDYLGWLAADALGNVHAVVFEDTVSPSTWRLRYRMLPPGGAFTPAVLVTEALPATYGSDSYACFALAVEASTGAAHLIYRDFAAGGRLRQARKGLFEATFTVLADLTGPTTATNEIVFPSARGTLEPVFNRVDGAIDLTYRLGGAAPFLCVHQPVPTVPGALLTLGAAAMAGAALPVVLLSPGEGGRPYACAFSAGTSPGIPLGDGRFIPLQPDGLFWYSLDPSNLLFTNNLGVLGAQGSAFCTALIPASPPLTGLTVYAAGATGDPAASLGISRITPALAILLP